MIIDKLVDGGEANPIYKKMEGENGLRQHNFLKSIVEASIATNRPFLSQTLLKGLNFHSIACLHTNAGEYRSCSVHVGNKYFPEHWELPDLMDDFTNNVNRHWDRSESFNLAAFVLWRVNAIHPFINGNGRTARAACFFVLCVKSGRWLPNLANLPGLIRKNRAEYTRILKKIDQSWQTKSGYDQALAELTMFLRTLVINQILQAVRR